MHGLIHCIRNEKNFRIQFVIALIAIAGGIFLSINPYEWIGVLFCIALVLSLEMINSSIERICNFICPSTNVEIKKIKDMSAGAVLLAACISLIIGCIIFLPKIIFLL